MTPADLSRRIEDIKIEYLGGRHAQKFEDDLLFLCDLPAPRKADSMKTETPKMKVLRRYPKAFCECNGPGFQIVTLGKYAVATVLGFTYRNPRAAWAAAARALRARAVRRGKG